MVMEGELMSLTGLRETDCWLRPVTETVEYTVRRFKSLRNESTIHLYTILLNPYCSLPEHSAHAHALDFNQFDKNGSTLGVQLF